MNLEKLEVAAGLEPAKTGFADQRLDRFGIATYENPCLNPYLNPAQTLCNLYPELYPNLYPKCPRNAYLPLFKSL